MYNYQIQSQVLHRDRAFFNPVKYVFLIGLAAVLFRGQPANAQPHIYTIGLVLTDLVDQELLPVHLAEHHPLLMRKIDRAITGIFADLGRFRTVRLPSVGEAHDPVYQGGSPSITSPTSFSTKPIKHTTTELFITTRIRAY